MNAPMHPDTAVARLRQYQERPAPTWSTASYGSSAAESTLAEIGRTLADEVERLRTELDARTGRADVLRQEAHEIVASCPEHGDWDTCWPECHCTVAEDMLRRAGAGPDERETGTPTPLRWGLDDAELGDDDSVTLWLSGPAREPYVLELEPDRAAGLREALAGSDVVKSLVVTHCPGCGDGLDDENISDYCSDECEASQGDAGGGRRG